MRKTSAFIVLEGPDKCGKSTQAALLVRALESAGLGVVHTREPGGTSFAEAVRRVVLDPVHEVDPLAELFLYEAARAQHTAEVLRPALAAGKTVVSERYTLATLAYQGHGRGLELGMVRRLNALATGGLTPDLTFVLDMPESRFRTRAPDRVHDRLERESSRFRRKVAAAYRSLARTERGIELVDADRLPEKIHAELLERVGRLLGRELKPA